VSVELGKSTAIHLDLILNIFRKLPGDIFNINSKTKRLWENNYCEKKFWKIISNQTLFLILIT
ncbi:hypothetical protein NXH65_10085, partial [Bacteroides caccae]|uniref:hypothetical protein n=1 Tax=Bacteroides caccae TaxID=47678 RepID=UPI00234F2611